MDKGRVLVCDDDADTRDLLMNFIDRQRFEVVTVETGSAALEELLSGTVDCAFLDIGLPDIDGFEVARRSRAVQLVRRPRLVAVTGYSSSSDFAKSRSSGFDMHLVKPVTLETISAVLATLKVSAPVADSR